MQNPKAASSQLGGAASRLNTGLLHQLLQSTSGKNGHTAAAIIKYSPSVVSAWECDNVLPGMLHSAIHGYSRTPKQLRLEHCAFSQLQIWEFIQNV